LTSWTAVPTWMPAQSSRPEPSSRRQPVRPGRGPARRRAPQMRDGRDRAGVPLTDRISRIRERSGSAIAFARAGVSFPDRTGGRPRRISRSGRAAFGNGAGGPRKPRPVTQYAVPLRRPPVRGAPGACGARTAPHRHETDRVKIVVGPIWSGRGTALHERDRGAACRLFLLVLARYMLLHSAAPRD